MDLSRLTRPAILCQCSRCSSSLAALENEWAKLPNSNYSIVTGWLSVDLHRISISPEKKPVSQSSEVSLLRGRDLQEISCKLCQQKLGLLCSLANGPNILWKLSKVAFREIVTMRTVDPVFKDGTLERYLNSPPRESRRVRTSLQPGALVPAGSTEIENYDNPVSRQIHYHFTSIHDTMSELKQAFTALQLELNVPNRLSSETLHTGNDLVMTVLKELKSKSEDNERLKLEVEALKLKNRYMEEQAAKQSVSMAGLEGALPQVRDPGSLQGSRKRPWPDSFPSGRTQPIADSFDDEEDLFDDFTLSDEPVRPTKIPLKDPEDSQTITDSTEQPQETPRLRIEIPQQIENTNTPSNDPNTSSPQKAIVKRSRVSQPADKASTNSTEKKKPGRPRKSISQTPNPDLLQTPRQTPLTGQTTNMNNNGSQKEKPIVIAGATQEQRSGANANQPARSQTLRSRSRPPSVPPAISRKSRQSNWNGKDSENHPSSTGANNLEIPMGGTGKENADETHENIDRNELNETRKRRDDMARLTLQREEAMEMEEAR